MTKVRHSFGFYLLATVLAVNLLAGFRVFSVEAERRGEDEAFEKISVMMRVLHLLQKDYVDPKKVDFEDLIYNALRGMVSSLDPFSGFMTAAEYDDMMESTEGEFGGLGIIVTVKDDALTVVAPIEDTPSSRAGLLAGDQIVEIAGQSTQDMPLSEMVGRLKGAPGTTVTIKVFRPNTGETLTFTIERAMIPVVSVKDTKVIEGNIGYVRIVQFNEPTSEKLGEALEYLNTQGVSSLVLDLRNNPGGLLESAVDVCSYFLPTKTLVVSTAGRQPSQQRDFHAVKMRKFPAKPVAILINRGSASAAEIVAGCLQDWGRAVLVGEKSFGKGSVQNIIGLPDGSALRLTTAMYTTPSKRVIHENGIEPDIEVVLTDEELRQMMMAQHEGLDSEPAGAVAPHGDRQLKRAVDTLKSYEVYLHARKSRFRELPPPAEAEATEKGKK